jgi:tetratricopeptide (TPR) repeat protein
MNKLILTFLFALLIGCATTETNTTTEQMDIGLTKLPAQADEAQSQTKVGDSKNLTLPPNAKVDWQRFFKSPPDTQQRSLLEKELVAQKDTEDVASLLKKGRNELALGRIPAAENSFRQVLRKDNNNNEALLELSQLYLRRKELGRTFEFLAQVRDQLQSMEKKDTSLVFRYRYILALAYIAREEVEEGHKILSDLIAIDKSFAPGYAALASSYLNLGKVSVAEFIIRRGLDRGGEGDAALYNLLGVISQKSNDNVQALEHFNKALKLAPGYIPAMVNRARTMIESRQFDPAELDLQQAITMAPSSVEAHIALGICKKQMGRFDAAKAAFARAIELDPESASARFNMGVLLADKFQKPGEALRLFYEVTQTKEHNPEIKNLAQVYLDDLRQNR